MRDLGHVLLIIHQIALTQVDARLLVERLQPPVIRRLARVRPDDREVLDDLIGVATTKVHRDGGDDEPLMVQQLVHSDPRLRRLLSDDGAEQLDLDWVEEV